MTGRQKIGIILGIAFITVLPLAAEEPALHFGVAGIYTHYLTGFFLPIPSGIIGTLTISKLQLFQGSEARLRFTLGSGLTTVTHYRGADGKSYGTASQHDSDLAYWGRRVDITYAINLANNFSPSADYALSPFIMFRGISAPQVHESPLPTPIWDNGMAAYFRHEFLGGFSYSSIRETDDILALRQGFFAEISLGYAFDSAVRLSLASTLYAPIVAADRLMFEFRGRLLGDYLFAPARYDDYAVFGGSKMRRGLGSSVRGFEDSSYSTALKLALNTELRFTFAPFDEVAINPGVLLFADAGIYGGESDIPIGGLMSVGGGLVLDLFNLLVLTARIEAPLVGERLDGRPFVFYFGISDHI